VAGGKDCDRSCASVVDESAAIAIAKDSTLDISSALIFSEKSLFFSEKAAVTAENVESLCQQIAVQHCYWVTQAQREQMMQMSLPNKCRRL
jgi:hypothetical protein